MDPSLAEKVLKEAAGKRIAVLGDYMVDRHLSGTVRRISPEAPVPVVEIESETTGLGGAGNVVRNIAGLGAVPLAFGVVGNDAVGKLLLGHLEVAGASLDGMVAIDGRCTTEKVRIIAGDQHVVRVDRENEAEINSTDTRRLIEELQKAMPSVDALILQDYNKGVLTSEVIRTAIGLAAGSKVPVAVDPKFNNFFSYNEAYLFKPNVRELGRALGRIVESDEQLQSAALQLIDRMRIGNLLITRGERGMTLFLGCDRVEHIATRARKVHDVSGAGDTVIATLMTAAAGGADLVQAAVLSNYAAGVVCGEVGVQPIEKDRLMDEILRDFQEHRATSSGG